MSVPPRDEIAQRLRAGFPMPPAYWPGTEPGRHAVHNLARVHFGEDDGVKVIGEMAVLQVGIAHEGEGELVLLEQPARPARIDIAAPGFVEGDARLLY